MVRKLPSGAGSLSVETDVLDTKVDWSSYSSKTEQNFRMRILRPRKKSFAIWSRRMCSVHWGGVHRGMMTPFSERSKVDQVCSSTLVPQKEHRSSLSELCHVRQSCGNRKGALRIRELKKLAKIALPVFYCLDNR